MEPVIYVDEQITANHGEVIKSHSEIETKKLEILAKLPMINHWDLKYDPSYLNDENYSKENDEVDDEEGKVGKSLFIFINKNEKNLIIYSKFIYSIMHLKSYSGK